MIHAHTTYGSSFAFCKGTDELIPLIHMKVKEESDLLVARERFWKQNGVEVSVVAGFS